jgi:hypothetical protein
MHVSPRLLHSVLRCPSVHVDFFAASRPPPLRGGSASTTKADALRLLEAEGPEAGREGAAWEGAAWEEVAPAWNPAAVRAALH